MYSKDPIRTLLPADEAALDAVLESLPEESAVFFLQVGDGQQPYLGRCGNLRRRAKRLLRPTTGSSRMLNLRGVAKEAVYWPVSSSLEGNLILLEQARLHFPDRYRRMLKLRFPYFVRVTMENRFPRVTVTHNTRNPDTTFGPFLYRSHAEDFAGKALDQFLLRRCEEDLQPHRDHPGCIYGEMNSCLRPCQEAVSENRYRTEALGLVELLETGGETLRDAVTEQREAASEALDFETAARLHKRLQKLEELWKPANDLRGILSGLSGVAVAADIEPGWVNLWPVWAGHLQGALRLRLDSLGAKELAAALAISKEKRLTHRAETHRELLAVLTKWRHSSWCDGEWVRFESDSAPRVRRVANAANRVHTAHFGHSEMTAPAGE